MGEAQEYIISNLYPATVKATGQQRSFVAHGNELFVWRLFFEGMDGYYLTNRKGDNVPQKGDTVYGTIGQDQFGNATFKSESRPMGSLPTNSVATRATSSSNDDEKLDYIIGLVEGIAEKVGSKDVILDDIEDKPIDLSEIPF